MRWHLNLSLLLILGNQICNGELLYHMDMGHAPSSLLTKTDDGYSLASIIPNQHFPFFGENITKFYVSMNGLISFNKPVTSYDVRNWPTVAYELEASFVAAFWADANGYFVGDVKHRQSVNLTELETAKSVIQSRYNNVNFKPSYLFLAEWNNISPCDCYFPRNRFQVALVTDGCASYAIFSYNSVLWGNEEGARVGVVRVDTGTHEELDASVNRQLETLTANHHVLRLSNGTCVDSVDGGWGEWIDEGACFGDCGIGMQFQVRLCNDPTPKDGGLNCVGPSLHSIPCDLPGCPVNGSWSEWINGACSETCGNGEFTRTRECNDPTPANGGASCPGAEIETLACNLVNCPIDGNWGHWINEGNCSQPCGEGAQTQRRNCDSPSPEFGGNGCPGNSTRTVSCFIENCPVDGGWSSWLELSPCSKTCGGGLQTEYRLCNEPTPRFGGKDCNGIGERIITCNANRCPDLCTIQNAADNDFVYNPNDPSFYCLCMRTSDNTQSFIQECYACNAGTQYVPEILSCGAKVEFRCQPDPFCVGKTPNRNYSINEGQPTSSCSNKYYFCDALLQVHEFTCGMTDAGVYFDSSMKQCVPGNPPADQCSNAYCVGRNDGNYDRVDDTCRTFFQCTNFVVSERSCQGFYDVSLRRCVLGPDPPLGQNCIHPSCHNKLNGRYVQDDTCAGYYDCVNQRRTNLQFCGNDEYYDNNTQTCNTTYPGAQCQHIFCRDNLRNGILGNFSRTRTNCFAEYVTCSGSATLPQNVLKLEKCPDNSYFHITNQQTLVGECRASPPSSSCSNYRCIGRPDGYSIQMDGDNNCRQYYRCFNQIEVVTDCPQNTYFNGLICSSTINELLCQHPDCIANGPGDYPLISNNECSASYYACNDRLYRTVQSCQISVTGEYFGKNSSGLFECIEGDAPSSCGGYPGYICIGKSEAVDHDDPEDPYCRNYIACTLSGAIANTCPNGGYFNINTRSCQSGIPGNQGCWIDGGITQWSSWQYSTGSTCSVDCGPNGVQQQIRTRSCTNPAPSGGGTRCDGLPTIESRNETCQIIPPACGDDFCIGKDAGSYSKSLLLTPPVTLACFKDYYICSGPPENVLSFGNCPNADYVFVPGSGCLRGNIDPLCPANECTRKIDGLYGFSGTHDCRQYLNCSNEFATVLNCPTGGDGRPLYFSDTSKNCTSHANQNCDPIIGFWSDWISDGSQCVISNGQCVQRQIRTCSDPPPRNDPNACPGDAEQFVSCQSCVDPCSLIPNPCIGTNAVCVSTPNQGSGYTCSCPTGYLPTGSGNLLSCSDINECLSSPCDANANCVNTPGSFSCTCNTFYRGDGFTCNDINECSENLNDCHSNAGCSNVIGSPGFTCQCNNGFEGDGVTCTDVNECTRNSDTCHLNANCINNIGSYSCACQSGYQGNGFICTDIDECTSGSNACHQDGVCSNNAGSYTCSCNIGYTGNGFSCADINECNLNTDSCHANANCFNTVGSYTCQCQLGYSGTGLICVDVDECATNADACHENAVCTNTIGSYTCACGPGYSGNGFNCIDVNECFSGASSCDVNAICINNVGSYTCQCETGYTGNGFNCTAIDACVSNTCSVNARCDVLPSGGTQCTCNVGFTGDGQTCTDINECADNTNSCHANATCVNTVGSYTCSCKEFFSGNGFNCVDVNECLENTDNCDTNAICSNLIGTGFTCQCRVGWQGNGVSCSDINECSSNLHNCDTNAFCTNLIGTGFSCTCNNGFSGNGISCTDVDECVANTDNCHSNADCINTQGSYTCACRSGYTGDGRICTDVDECVTSNNCHSFADCVNSVGNYSCFCRIGYFGNGFDCTDIDECSSNSDNCHDNAICTNTVGSYSCVCRNGFSGDGISCIDTNECSFGTDNCDSNADCSNTIGSYTCTCRAGYSGDGFSCVAVDGCLSNNCHLNATCQPLVGGNFQCICNNGFAGDGITCTNIDECLINTDSCHANANCVDTIGSYECTCQSGYIGDGRSCIDTNECVLGIDSCHENADCSNTIGSYTCTCRTGYTGDGFSCVDIDECAASNNCHSNAVCTNNDGSYTCACRIGFSGDGFNCVGTAATCDGRFNGDRIVNAGDPTGRSYLECQNNIGVQMSCPNGVISSFDLVFGFLQLNNGMLFSPYFKTCVNTTTGLPHPAITDIKSSCEYIADTTLTGKGTRLPIPTSTGCNDWLVCENQQLVNEDSTPPIVGTCNTGLKYDGDQRLCVLQSTSICLFP